MRYKNIKTGTIIDSPCKIIGGKWQEIKPKPVKKSTNKKISDKKSEE